MMLEAGISLPTVSPPYQHLARASELSEENAFRRTMTSLLYRAEDRRRRGYLTISMSIGDFGRLIARADDVNDVALLRTMIGLLRQAIRRRRRGFHVICISIVNFVALIDCSRSVTQ
jgi:hypothetical protein